MSQAPAPLPPACPRTAAMLALHLDGDLAPDFAAGRDDDHGYAFACGDSLREHLRDCPRCQTALRRARRLDAALAQAAGAALAAHGAAEARERLEQRWFAAVSAAAETPASLQGEVLQAGVGGPKSLVAASGAHADDRVTRRRLLPRCVLPLACAAAVTFALAAVLLQPMPRPLVGLPPLEIADVHLPPAATPNAPAPAAPAPTPTQYTAAAIQHLRAADRRLGERRQNEHAVGTPHPDERPAAAPEELGQRFADGRLDPAERLRAFDRLLEVARGAGTDALLARTACIEQLAGGGDGGDGLLRGEAYTRLRGSPGMLGELRSRLIRLDAEPDAGGQPFRAAMATVFVASNIADRELDQWLRRVVRHRPDLVTGVLAAARSGLRPHGTATLLLELWALLDARGAVADEATFAATWFVGQPAVVLAEVGELLRTSRSAPTRQRCLLALGHAADDTTVPVLLRTMRTAPRGEALTAAFALGTLPHPVLAPLAADAADDDWLLHAALARAGLPAARAWLDALDLRPHELVRFARATLADWPGVAPWFRDRAPQLGD
ncbi:MAG: hypothetical protein IT455_10185 [Planctomycetes bacterium]|nr:hypothetical protein [Planctomycetota bacterium]